MTGLVVVVFAAIVLAAQAIRWAVHYLAVRAVRRGIVPPPATRREQPGIAWLVRRPHTRHARQAKADAPTEAISTDEAWASARRMLDGCPFCHGTGLDSRTCNCPEEGCRRPWCPRYDTTAGCAPGRDCGPGCECR